MLHVDDVYSRAYVTPEKWVEPPPAFREVTADNLKFDLEDALKMQKRIMGCHNPQELVVQYRRVRRRCLRRNLGAHHGDGNVMPVHHSCHARLPHAMHARPCKMLSLLHVPAARPGQRCVHVRKMQCSSVSRCRPHAWSSSCPPSVRVSD